jgi:phosphohistidine swiveling domain-containing protein
MLEENYTGHRRDTGEAVAFPVTWPDAEDAQRTWRWDAEHNPFPLTDLSEEFSRRAWGPAIAVQPLGGSAPGPTTGLVAHGYRYGGGHAGSGPRSATYPENVATMAPRVEELWDRGWRLQIEARAREIAGFDYDSLTLTELVKRLESLTEGVSENMVLMFRASHLVSYSRGRLVDFCVESVGKAAESLVTDLLQGTPSISLESGAALWDVAQMLARNSDLFDRLAAQPDAQTLASLGEAGAGVDFVAKFNDWLDRYGHRNGSFGELAEPSWCEEPRVPIALLLQYVEAEDPRQSQKKAITTREKVQREFEKRLGNQELIARFRELLAGAAPYLGVRESRDHAINMALTAVRVPALALGRRLVGQGAIQDVDDVFFLQFRDLESAAEDPELDLRALVARRREIHEYWRNVVPPVTIGVSAGRETDRKASAASAPVLSLVEGAASSSVVWGIAASPGIVTARARVIMTLDEAHTLQRGEVLVTRSTSPAWTPLFGSAAAVVTEGGGVLSHCAIVAREYGIPAVVGATGASARIRDGATITVDGTKGRVTIQ